MYLAGTTLPPGYTLSVQLILDETSLASCDPDSVVLTDGVFSDPMGGSLPFCGSFDSPCSGSVGNPPPLEVSYQMDGWMDTCGLAYWAWTTPGPWNVFSHYSEMCILACGESKGGLCRRSEMRKRCIAWVACKGYEIDRCNIEMEMSDFGSGLCDVELNRPCLHHLSCRRHHRLRRCHHHLSHRHHRRRLPCRPLPRNHHHHLLAMAAVTEPCSHVGQWSLAKTVSSESIYIYICVCVCVCVCVRYAPL